MPTLAHPQHTVLFFAQMSIGRSANNRRSDFSHSHKRTRRIASANICVNTPDAQGSHTPGGSHKFSLNIQTLNGSTSCAHHQSTNQSITPRANAFVAVDAEPLKAAERRENKRIIMSSARAFSITQLELSGARTIMKNFDLLGLFIEQYAIKRRMTVLCVCCFFLRPRLRCSRTRQKTHPHTERRCCLETFRAFHLYHSFIRSHKFRCFFARGRRYNPRRISFICLNLFLFRLRLRTLSFIHVRNVREQQRGHAENELTYPAAMLQAFFTRPSVYHERIILIPCFVNVLFFCKYSTGERHKIQQAAPLPIPPILVYSEKNSETSCAP